MYKNSKIGREDEENQFVKGMTLEQYMANSHFNPTPTDSLEETLEENLYQSSHFGGLERNYSKKRHYRIDQIDEESVEDSKDYHGHQDTLETPGFEQVEQHQTITEQNEHSKPNKGRTNSISMSTAITFKNTQPDPSHFRIKRLSMSPTKKKSDIPVPLPGASITLYGCKFGPSAPKPQKMPEMLTFYGKLHLDSGDDLISRKTSVKESDLKQKYKKKSQLQLNKMLQFDTHFRVGGKGGYPDLRVDGLQHRKNKFM